MHLQIKTNAHSAFFSSMFQKNSSALTSMGPSNRVPSEICVMLIFWGMVTLTTFAFVDNNRNPDGKLCSSPFSRVPQGFQRWKVLWRFSLC